MNTFKFKQVQSQSILMAKTMRKMSLKIQIIAGNNLNSCPDATSQETLPLVQVLFEFEAMMLPDDANLPTITIYYQLILSQFIFFFSKIKV